MARSTTRVRRWRSGLPVLLTLVFVLTACGGRGGDEAVELREDAALSERIRQVQREGGSALLRERVEGDWDTVHVFPDPVSQDFVERRVGAPVDMLEFFAIKGQVLVFLRAGEVWRAVYTTPNNLVEGEYSNRVRVQARTEPPNSPLLDLVEPPA
jgi:hypothetical protein